MVVSKHRGLHVIDYSTIISAAGVGVAAIATLWRTNTELKREIKKDISQLHDNLTQDMDVIRKVFTSSKECTQSVQGGGGLGHLEDKIAAAPIEPENF